MRIPLRRATLEAMRWSTWTHVPGYGWTPPAGTHDEVAVEERGLVGRLTRYFTEPESVRPTGQAELLCDTCVWVGPAERLIFPTARVTLDGEGVTVSAVWLDDRGQLTDVGRNIVRRARARAAEKETAARAAYYDSMDRQFGPHTAAMIAAVSGVPPRAPAPPNVRPFPEPPPAKPQPRPEPKIDPWELAAVLEEHLDGWPVCAWGERWSWAPACPELGRWRRSWGMEEPRSALFCDRHRDQTDEPLRRWRSFGGVPTPESTAKVEKLLREGLRDRAQFVDTDPPEHHWWENEVQDMAAVASMTWRLERAIGVHIDGYALAREIAALR